jgi:hypothetical protein
VGIKTERKVSGEHAGVTSKVKEELNQVKGHITKDASLNTMQVMIELGI